MLVILFYRDCRFVVWDDKVVYGEIDSSRDWV